MIATLYLDVNAFVFFISQPDWVYFSSLSSVAGDGWKGGQGNICVLQGRKQEAGASSASVDVTREGCSLLFSWSTWTSGDRRKYKMKSVIEMLITILGTTLSSVMLRVMFTFH